MSLLILDLQLSPSLNQNLDNFNLAFFCGLVKESVAVFMLPVDIFTLKELAGEPCRSPTQQQ